MRWTLERAYLAGASLVLAILLASGIYEYRGLQNVVTSSQWVTHTVQVLQELEGLEGANLAAESAARGYAIAGNKATLAPYDPAIQECQVHLQRLRDLTRDNPEQQQTLITLSQLLEQRQALLRKLVEGAKGEGAVSVVLQGEQQMGAIRQILRDMSDKEYRLLEQRNDLAAAEHHRTEGSVGAGITFAVAVVLAGTLLLRIDYAKRSKAETALRSAEQRLRAVAENVQEGIISTDSEGRIVSWNPAANRIFGYSRPEALGRAIEMLMPERFRTPSAEELTRYLRGGDSQVLGRTVELVGRRKDGLEFPIELSLTTWQLDDAVFFTGTVRDITGRKRAEERLRESEERFRLVVQEVRDYAIMMLGPEGNVLSWNLGAQRITGYKYDEIMGKHFSVFYEASDIAAGKPGQELKLALADGRFEDEGWRLRKDGSRFWANVVVTALHDETGGLKGFSKVARDFTERRQAQQALRDLSGRLLRAEDQERRRLAREFHDGTSQTLASMQLQLALLQDLIPARNVEARESLSELGELVDRCAGEIRTLSHLLHPPILEEAGLESAIRSYVEGFGRRSGISVMTDIPGDLPRFNLDVETALFRITQEALANIHRHSGSKTAQIRAALIDRQIVLEIRDQGRGIPAELLSNPAKLGVGIRGMTERVRLLGGELKIESDEGGTTIRAELPSETPVPDPPLYSQPMSEAG